MHAAAALHRGSRVIIERFRRRAADAHAAAVVGRRARREVVGVRVGAARRRWPLARVRRGDGRSRLVVARVRLHAAGDAARAVVDQSARGKVERHGARAALELPAARAVVERGGRVVIDRAAVGAPNDGAAA
eukprot:6438809-Prymnesium_polylepis.1